MQQVTQHYVFLPQRLLADLQTNPVAIGVYALIARLFLIYQEPIPLSAADLQRYDPALRYGAARGALQRLTALGWLHDRQGHKNQYLPTWGTVKGATVVWHMGAPTLGRPAHVRTLRLDRHLLDVGLGKCVPHPTYPARTTERYLEQPIFSLRDVGAYALVQHGHVQAATYALLRYGLVRDGQPQPLPPVADLIALASQQTLAGDGAAPTEQGRRVLGLEPEHTPAAATSQPLFFVDQAVIPSSIPCSIHDLIPLMHAGKTQPSAAATSIPSVEAMAGIMPGHEGIKSETSDSLPAQARCSSSSGTKSYSNQPKKATTDTPSETARRLQMLNAFPTTIRELSDLPIAVVEQAIAYAEATPGIKQPTGWIVEALRRHRNEGWPIPSLPTPQHETAPAFAHEPYFSGAYGDLFRLGSDLSCAQHIIEPCIESQAVIPEINDLTEEVQTELRQRYGRTHTGPISDMRVTNLGQTSEVRCPTQSSLAVVQRELQGALRHILGQIGAPTRLVFRIGAIST